MGFDKIVYTLSASAIRYRLLKVLGLSGRQATCQAPGRFLSDVDTPATWLDQRLYQLGCTVAFSFVGILKTIYSVWQY